MGRAMLLPFTDCRIIKPMAIMSVGSGRAMLLPPTSIGAPSLRYTSINFFCRSVISIAGKSRPVHSLWSQVDHRRSCKPQAPKDGPLESP